MATTTKVRWNRAHNVQYVGVTIVPWGLGDVARGDFRSVAEAIALLEMEYGMPISVSERKFYPVIGCWKYQVTTLGATHLAINEFPPARQLEYTNEKNFMLRYRIASPDAIAAHDEEDIRYIRALHVYETHGGWQRENNTYTRHGFFLSRIADIPGEIPIGLRIANDGSISPKAFAATVWPTREAALAARDSAVEYFRAPVRD